MNQTFDVVIIGGGLVGSALARALESTQFSIAVIEAQPAQMLDPSPIALANADLRVSAINRASELFLSGMDVWQRMTPERLSPYQTMRVWDGQGTGHIQFTAQEVGEPHLGHIIENRLLQSALMDGVMVQNNVQLFNPAKLEQVEQTENGEYLLQLDTGQLIKTRLLVAADGARSWVRNWADFEMREWDYKHHGLVCTVEVENSHERCAWQRFTEDGVLAFLPLAQPNLCSIVWSCPEDKANTLLQLSEAEFKATLTQAFEGQLGKVTASGDKVAIPLRQRHAKSYVKGGVVLIGDAAHTIHPLAGQGVNLGFMDAYVLADELKQAGKKGLSPAHPQVLSRYERRRMPENLSMMATMEGFKQLFAIKVPTLRWLRNWGMNKVNQMGFVKNHLVQAAMGSKRTIR